MWWQNWTHKTCVNRSVCNPKIYTLNTCKMHNWNVQCNDSTSTNNKKFRIQRAFVRCVRFCLSLRTILFVRMRMVPLSAYPFHWACVYVRSRTIQLFVRSKDKWNILFSAVAHLPVRFRPTVGIDATVAVHLVFGSVASHRLFHAKVTEKLRSA